MAACEVCGNDSEIAFEVRAADALHTFDSFECAVHRLAPVCDSCGCRVLGAAHRSGGRFYCCGCAHCAHVQDHTARQDHTAGTGDA
ncbi:hypothetical protein [Streptomyces sp. NBC_00859]|uniref:hypothetical protein n=1 Tax=Streptomyces sp. NBC_00859 TaxID=2903682 RepID=UPI0038672930|nr:hypothetical protein OG584_02080 [Streptomyces sp. NBC_00859]